MTATKPTYELPLSRWSDAQDDARLRPKRRIQAPFLLTCMSRNSSFWLWSRRGKQWIVEQEIVVDAGCRG